jgi:exodeoxyribonuclease V alpha subunit
MLGRGDLLVVDEAGMLDQDTARALLEIAQACQARVAFMGDRHQLPAVGRGGVLDLAAQHAGPDATLCLDVVHRFADPEYAELSVAMRRGESVFDELWERGQIRVHPSEAERTQTLAAEAADAFLAGHSNRALMADSREQVAALNGAIRDRLVTAGLVDDSRVVMNETGERLGVGDRVATRRNDWQLGVANRQTWTIAALGGETLTLRNDHGLTREVPTWYAQGWVESAYATTVYGAQGETTAIGNLVMGDGTSAASAYVGMTRGRHDNVAHLVAETPDQARSLWEGACSRGRADLGVAHARLQAMDAIDRYGPAAPAGARAKEQSKRRRQPDPRREFEPWHTPAPDTQRSRLGPSLGF